MQWRLPTHLLVAGAFASFAFTAPCAAQQRPKADKPVVAIVKKFDPVAGVMTVQRLDAAGKELAAEKLVLDRSCTIAVDGKPGKPEAICPGDRITLTYDPATRTVSAVQIDSPKAIAAARLKAQADAIDVVVRARQAEIAGMPNIPEERRRQAEARAAAAREVARRQDPFDNLDPIAVLNNSGKEIAFTLNAIRDKHGNDYVLVDDRPKSNLENGLKTVNDILGGPNQKPVTDWVLAPGQRLALTAGTNPIRSNYARFTIKNEHGKTSHERANVRPGSEFVLAVEPADVHTPVLATLGVWKFDQDITYTTVSGRTPARATTFPVKGYGTNKIIRYDTYFDEARDYEYTKQQNGGVATATAEIHNPTDKALNVSITLEFSFQDLLLRKPRVTSEFAIPAATKGTVRMEVNTRGIIKNREVTGVALIDLTTTAK